ncbi:MAG: hypothetical protein O3B45_03890 [Bacteroidetes bacterium]|jgi:hypothetical protein|nr:hypothetical protein [Bacteroidota bacterium]
MRNGRELFNTAAVGCRYSSALNYSELASDDNGLGFFEESPTTCSEDLNSDGVVGMGDLLILLASFGNACV